MNTHTCARCNKTLASSQSLWNHRQRCKNTTKVNRDTSRNGFLKPRIDSIADKDKFIADIINKVDQRAKGQSSTSILPRVNSVPKIRDLKEDESSETDSKSDSEDSDPESSDKSIPDDLEELKEAFWKLYKRIYSNMDNYTELVLILDKLKHVNCLTKDECNGIKETVRRKIGVV